MTRHFGGTLNKGHAMAQRWDKVRGTTSNSFGVGNGRSGSKKFEAVIGPPPNPDLTFNDTTKGWEFTEDGVHFFPFGTQFASVTFSEDMEDGHFGYYTANNSVRRTDAAYPISAVCAGAHVGVAGRLLVGGVVPTALFSLGSPVPLPGDRVFLARADDEPVGAAAGKVTTRAPGSGVSAPIGVIKAVDAGTFLSTRRAEVLLRFTAVTDGVLIVEKGFSGAGAPVEFSGLSGKLVICHTGGNGYVAGAVYLVRENELVADKLSAGTGDLVVTKTVFMGAIGMLPDTLYVAESAEPPYAWTSLGSGGFSPYMRLGTTGILIGDFVYYANDTSGKTDASALISSRCLGVYEGIPGVIRVMGRVEAANFSQASVTPTLGQPVFLSRDDADPGGAAGKLSTFIPSAGYVAEVGTVVGVDVGAFPSTKQAAVMIQIKSIVKRV